MRNRFTLLSSIGLGALATYIFDPVSGRRRRALIRDKATALKTKTTDAMDVTSRDLRNRTTGLAAEAKSWLHWSAKSDDTLEQRICSKIATLVSYPHSIRVKNDNGKVVLSGPILVHEVDALLKHVSGMRDVHEVDNKLEVCERADLVPDLQDEAWHGNKGQVLDIAQSNWSPSTRFVAGTFGAGLALFGARKLSIWGTALAGLGGAIFTRAVSNIEFRRLTGIGAGRKAVTVHKTINVAAPVETVFKFWSSYENFPEFMANVHEVKLVGGNRSHWVARGPGNTHVEWDAIVTEYTPNKKIAWETTDDSSEIQHSGVVRFDPNPDGSTRVSVHMDYNPMAGAIGHAAARMFGADPKSEMDEDLNRMKTMVETGKIPSAGTSELFYTH
jgi:uncharacterized membrane protein